MNFLKRISVSEFEDVRGTLSVCEISNQIEFETKRLYYITQVSSDASRGSHGHRKLDQIFFCVKGKFDLTVTDTVLEDNVTLYGGGAGYYLPAGLWRNLKNFSSDCVCLVLASAEYDPEDYIHSLSDYREWRRSNES